MSGKEYSRLLQRQVRRHGPADLVQVLAPFLDKVNESYEHYEQDRELLSRAMELSSNELNTANRELHRSNESLESFSYAAAHDLKNHALNIQSMVVLMKKYWNTDPEKLETSLGFLDRSMEQFMRTVQGFLHVSRAQEQVRTNNALVSQQALQEAVELECRHLIEKKNARIIWTWESSERLWPEHLVKTLLTNLVTNGIKYSRAGVHPVLYVLATSTSTATVLQVKDNGVGIDLKKHEKKLFSLFSRLNNTQGEEGTGVGLYLVKKLVESENGTLHVQSVPGEGTSMTMTFPKLPDGTDPARHSH
jgi:signal transduction histidine kinase